MDHILIIGLGSIGKRHVKTFRSLGINRIDAIRSGRSTLPEIPSVDNQYNELEEALSQKPDAAVICTPSAFHANTTIRLLSKDIKILVEKPLATNLDDLNKIEKLLKGKQSKLNVAYNMRYHPFIQKLRSWGHTNTPLETLSQQEFTLGQIYQHGTHGKTI